jgi:outer membrane autotransporter barrel domain
MKQNPFVLLTACLLFISVISQAQIKQGEKMLGGNISFSNETDDTKNPEYNYTSSRFSFTPQLGFGLANNWIVGVQAGFETRKETWEDNTDDGEDKSSGFTVGAFARKFQPFNEYCGFFGQGSLDVAFGKYESTTDFDGEDKLTGFSANIRPGLYFKPSSKWIVEATFGQLEYSTVRTKNDDEDYENKNNFFGLSFFDGLSFGVKFIL